MGGTTPYLQLPYPTGTDRVADGDNAIQALATRIETVEITDFQGMTLVAGWGEAGIAPGYRKVGDVVHLRGCAYVGAGGSSSANWVWLVPVGFRPPYDITFATIAVSQPGNVSKPQRLVIQTTGGNAFYLTCEYDSNPVPANGILVLEGLHWSLRP